MSQHALTQVCWWTASSSAAGECHRKFWCQFPGQPLPSKQNRWKSWKQQYC